MNTLAYAYLYIANMFTTDEEGQGMAEYGLILALVSIAVLVTLGLLGTQLDAKFQEVVTALGGGG